MKPKRLSTSEKILYGGFFAVIYFAVLFILAHLSYLMENADNFNYTLVMEHIKTQPFDLSPNFPWKQFLLYALIVSLIFLYIIIQYRHKLRFYQEREEGSAAWTENFGKYNKQYTEPAGVRTSTVTTGDKNISRNMILTQNIFLSMDTRQTQRNNNVLVVGGSGAGKSRFFVKPNILQRNCSYVVTDPSGELLESTGKYMEDAGYKVRVFNLVEMENSHHYNPFMYIRDDNGVNQLVNILITNTTPEGASKGDPFWEKSETALLLAIMFYLNYEIVREDQNFGNVMRLLLLGQVQESNEAFESPLDKIFLELEDREPAHLAVKYYKIFKQAAGKTAKSILISCTVRLAAFNLSKVQHLTNTDDIELAKTGDEPTITYVVIPSADTTYNFLVSMMYSQLFESLYFHAENNPKECPGKRLKHHVRFLLDEFANIGTIPDFEKKLATMRKYEISCSVILQNLAQLKTMYKDAWESIIGNCDSFLFLGGSEQTTLEYVSKKLGKATILANNYTKSRGQAISTSTGENIKGRDLMTPDELARLDNNYCVLFIRSLHPFYDRKYNYPNHPQYKYTGDADSANMYDYRGKFGKIRAAETITSQQKEFDRMTSAINKKNKKTDAQEQLSADEVINTGTDATNAAPAGNRALSVSKEAIDYLRGQGVTEDQIADCLKKIDAAREKFDPYFDVGGDDNAWKAAMDNFYENAGIKSDEFPVANSTKTVSVPAEPDESAKQPPPLPADTSERPIFASGASFADDEDDDEENDNAASSAAGNGSDPEEEYNPEEFM